MTDTAEIIRYATPEDLMMGLCARGAKTKPMASGEVRVMIRLPVGQKPKARHRRPARAPSKYFR